MQEIKSNNQNETNLIDILAKEYKEENWKDFINCFKQTNIKIQGIPQEIVNVIVELLGSNSGKEWLQTPFPMFQNKTALELLKTEKGTKALKQFILRMPM